MSVQYRVGLPSRAGLAWRPFTPAPVPARRSVLAVRPARVPVVRHAGKDGNTCDLAPEVAVTAAFLAFSATVGLPYQAEAQHTQPLPVVIEADGSTTSPANTFLRQPVLAAAGAQKLPEAPKVEGKTEKEPASTPAGGISLPSLPDASALVQESSSSVPRVAGLGAVAAVLGLGGFAFLSNNKADPAGGAKKAVKTAAPSASAGTKKIGAAARKAPGPVKSAIGGAQKQAKQPAKAAGGLFGGAKKQAQKPAKAAGGVFGGAKKEAKKPAKAASGLLGGAKKGAKKPAKAASSAAQKGGNLFGAAKQEAKKPAQAAGGLFGGAQKQAKQPAKQIQKAAKSVAPAGTKRIKKSGTAKIGGPKPKPGGKKPPPRFDEDTVTTIGAAGVVGLGILVGGFVILNIVTGVEDVTEAPAPQAVANKLPDVPSPLPSKPVEAAKGAAEQAAPQVAEKAKAAATSAPDASNVAPQAAKQAANAVPRAVEKAADKGQEAVGGAPKVAQKAEGAANEAPQIAQKAAAAVPGFDQKQDDSSGKAPAVAQKAEEAANKAPQVAQAAGEAAKSVPTPPPAPEVAQKAQGAIQDATPGLAKDAVPDPYKTPKVPQAQAMLAEKAKEAAVPQLTEEPKSSSAFEEARKKLGSGGNLPSAAEQFKAAIAEPPPQLKGDTRKGSPPTGSKGSPVKALPAPKSGNQNALILGGLVVVGGVAAAVSSRGGGGGGGGGEVGGVAPSAGTSAPTSSAGGSNGSTGKPSDGTGDVKEDIAQRKQEVQGWIKDWRQRTGGK